MSNPFVVGLTGGIGSGKSAVSHLFAELGIDVVDADIVAREVVEPGTSALKTITEHFGDSILNEDGSLNRPALRTRVFENDDDKQWLNALLHPAIRTEMQKQLKDATSPYVIFSVPLLIENGLDSLADCVLVVDCSEDTQLERATLRDGSNIETIKSIMASQATRQQRLAKAQDVIDNNGELSALPDQVKSLHQRYMQQSAQKTGR